MKFLLVAGRHVEFHVLQTECKTLTQAPLRIILLMVSFRSAKLSDSLAPNFIEKGVSEMGSAAILR
jgi:hypothetical protein